jgi:hypothetical protein
VSTLPEALSTFAGALSAASKFMLSTLRARQTVKIVPNIKRLLKKLLS